MAIPTNYIDKITDHDSGENRPICPPADHVSVDNENYDGGTLDEVLDEVAQAIEEAGQGGYAPPQGGIPKSDLAESVQDSLDKADSALQDDDVAEVAKTGDYDDLENKPTIPDTSDLATKTELQQGLAAKQDKLLAGNGITIGNDGKTVSVDAEVVQPVQADGTFTVRIGNNEYTIDLKHEHENMAKLVVDTAANLPDMSEMDSDTIYGVNEDGEISVLYVGGIPFYGGGGGGTSTPVLRQPADDSTIDMGNIASGESSVSKTITIKGKSLTQALTVAVTGTGYSVDKQSIPAADANVGTTLTITCTNTNGISAGTLSIASSEVSCDCDLVVYEDLRGVKLTGTQWLHTDYYPNALTEFSMICKFTPNSHTSDIPSVESGTILGCNPNTGDGKKFRMYIGGNSSGKPLDVYQLLFINESSVMYNNDYQILPYHSDSDRQQQQQFVADNSTIAYSIGASNGTLSFMNSLTSKSCHTSKKTSTMDNDMMIGYYQSEGIFSRMDFSIYSLTITEGGTVVRHWVPKMRNGVTPGLYDTVTGKFISSETSTELVAIPLT